MESRSGRKRRRIEEESEERESPNWMVRGLISPATRIATKLFSSVFTPESYSSSDESDSSHYDDDSQSDGGAGGDGDGYDIPSRGDDLSKKKNETLSEVKCLSKELQHVGRSETKRVIEELVMHETFSREESDRLIEMINSRVVDCSSMVGVQDATPNEIPSGRVGDLCSKAIMEAKKWLEGKKVGSSSEFDRSRRSSNTYVLDHVTEGEVGSPVDMARLYMQGRPPWASPIARHLESRSPSSTGIELFKEGSHSAQKRDSLAGGSWNIQDEIRRVRSKATENMLLATSSTKNDLPLFPLEPNYTRDSLFSETLGGNGDKIHGPISFEGSRPTNANVTLTVEAEKPIDPDLEMTFRDSQDMNVPKPKQIVEEGCAASKSHHFVGVELLSKQHTGTDGRSSDDNIPAENEVIGESIAIVLPISKSSVDVEEKRRKSNEEEPIEISDDKSHRIEGPCGFLTETSVAIPGGSENSMHYEEETAAAAGENVKLSSLVEKQPGKKANKYLKKRQGLRNRTPN